MRNSLVSSLIFFFGIIVGATSFWVNSYSTDGATIIDQNILKEILMHSNVNISPENYACEGEPVKNVGAVVASLLELNSLNSRNMLTHAYYGSVCTISVSSCKPWQEAECGTRFLKFDINNKNNIDASSFSCVDVP